MDDKIIKNSLLYFVKDISVIPILKTCAENNNLWLLEAEDVVDLYACDSKLVVVEKSLLDEDLYGSLRSTFIEKLSEQFYEEFPEVRDLPFDYVFVVFGDGPDIPEDMKQFFNEVDQLDEATLQKYLTNHP
jgi:hypothetical protein